MNSSLRLRRTAPCCLLLLLAFPAAAAPPPAEKIDDDAWFILRLQDQPCGFMHTNTRRVGDEVHTTGLTQIAIARDAAEVKIAMEMDYRESLDGRPLSFRNRMTMAQVPVTYEGTIKEGRLHLTIEQLGTRRETTYDFDPEVRFSWGQALEQRRRGLKPGTAFAVKIYDPALKVDGAVTMRLKVHGREGVDVLGERRMLTRVTSTMDLPMPLASDSWVDDDARPIVTTMDLGVLKVKLYQTTREEAMKKSPPPEMFINTFITTARRIGREARQVRLRLTLLPGDGPGIPDLPDTDMQTVQRKGPREVLLTIRRTDWRSIRESAPGGEPPTDTHEYLKASAMVDTADRRIRRLARTALKDASTPAEKADALRRAVGRHIEDKSLNIGFATASEVVLNRRGDCTEHGVLLAAVARAAGLPARGVSGIIEVPDALRPGGEGGAFGYHMWAQVYIAGRWVDLDAAFGETECNPTHVAMALMPLNDESMLDAMANLLHLMGRLRIEVLSVE